MTYSTLHHYVTLLGDAYNQAETWQVGVRLIPPGAPSPVTEAQLDGLVNVASAWMSDSRCNFPVTHRLTAVKVAVVATTGLYPDGVDAAERLLDPPELGGGISSGRQWPQLSLCVTTTTARTRGLASTGRYYPPPTLGVPDDSGRMNASVVESYTAAQVELLEGINGLGLGTANVMSAVEQGTSHPITGVRVGRVMDTQRRRRSSLSEDYFSAPLS